MAQHKVIVKIDLCGSKKFFDRNPSDPTGARKEVLAKLLEKVKCCYPYGEDNYPKGSIYSAQGDCIHVILEKPTVALRATIEFMKEWCGLVPSLPDCRAVMDVGEISEQFILDRLELVGEPFEVVSKIEKGFGPGTIGVTSRILQRTDPTLVQFLRRGTIAISDKRKEQIFEASYANPRLVEDSALVHALFIADPKGSEVRTRSLQVLMMECISERRGGKVDVAAIAKWLEKRGLRGWTEKKIIEEAEASDTLQMDEEGNFELTTSAQEALVQTRKSLAISKTDTINRVAKAISNESGLEVSDILSKLDVSKLVEEFLCSVFLEIRFMANYFQSSQTLFERLGESSQFDYIVRSGLEPVLANDPERFHYLKGVFLRALRQVVDHSRDNMYVAAIFHNVLLLYYLNQNQKFAQTQRDAIRGKRIFLDTNAFYAVMCGYSEFQDSLRFSLNKLADLGAEICIFDRSLEEYNDSLDSSLRNYESDHGLSIIGRPDSSWIMREFSSNPGAYRNDFRYAVSVHKVAADSDMPGSNIFSDPSKSPLNGGLIYETLAPFKNQADLGIVFDLVWQAKKRFNPVSKQLEIPGQVSVYHSKVLHDANCLSSLDCHGSTPLECESIFVTCDFGLARVRRGGAGNYPFLVTAPEFYEFMLPYLFLTNEVASSPLEMPNLLFSAALSASLKRALDFDALIGDFLVNRSVVRHDFPKLAEITNEARMRGIQERFYSIRSTSEDDLDQTEVSACVTIAAQVAAQYRERVREGVAHSFLKQSLYEKEEVISSLAEENRKLRENLARQEKKDRGRQKYEKKIRKQRGN